MASLQELSAQERALMGQIGRLQARLSALRDEMRKKTTQKERAATTALRIAMARKTAVR
jgi:prefoldin subunit 5